MTWEINLKSTLTTPLKYVKRAEIIHNLFVFLISTKQLWVGKYFPPEMSFSLFIAAWKFSFRKTRPERSENKSFSLP